MRRVRRVRRVRRAGLPPIRFHDLRHSAASLMLAAGVPMKVVSETLGHSRFSFTADVYTYVVRRWPRRRRRSPRAGLGRRPADVMVWQWSTRGLFNLGHTQRALQDPNLRPSDWKRTGR
ncbi:tyrosine-type recombinase/integrase [Streptosporangium carneum]|uniref:tyrosine-type recombinase/integrase n=1 Tax=Streptosporangium carneum TaxID=47481 RepID=UPI0022F346A7|nr:tyrosine-type recombinase/integrase [Streptosporangium carneum]